MIWNLEIASKQLSFISKPMLYFTILVVTCIASYPTVDRCIASTQDLYWGTDNSLVAMLIDSMFEDSETDSSGSNDDNLASVDFLSARMNWVLINAFSVQSKKVPSENAFPDSIPLKKFTPPPKA